MSVEHKELALGRWEQLSILEQMANIGSEVERALNWKARNNADYSRRAFERALELVDLSLAAAKKFPHLKELARLREALVDYFEGNNEFVSNEQSWKGYFLSFACAARRDHGG